MSDLSGKNILVLGGSSGIGLELINKVTASGGTVYKASRNLPSELSDKKNIHHIPLDVSKIDNELSDLPELHGVVYGLGSINLKPFQSLSEDDFQKDLDINLLGLVKVLKKCYKSLRKSGNASIVVYSTVAVAIGLNYHASIAAAKGAVEGLAKSLAAEWARSNIRINVIEPSLTDTPMAKNLLSTDEKKEASNKRHPLGRYGNPNDVAALTHFLLTDDASWITGQVIAVDGGISKTKIF